MHGYELTERGKILVAVVLVLLLLLIPSAILLYTAMSSQAYTPPADQDPKASVSPPPLIMETPPPEISESPPPNGGGFNPPDISPPNGNGSAGSQEPSKPPNLSQPSVDSSAGTLSFFFSPSLYNTIDAETSSMLRVFLSSPKNAPDSQISVEIPKLSDEDAEKTISAIVSAFAAFGVRQQRLAFITQPGEAADGLFKVSLSFSAQRTK